MQALIQAQAMRAANQGLGLRAEPIACFRGYGLESPPAWLPPPIVTPTRRGTCPPPPPGLPVHRPPLGMTHPPQPRSLHLPHKAPPPSTSPLPQRPLPQPQLPTSPPWWPTRPLVAAAALQPLLTPPWRTQRATPTTLAPITQPQPALPQVAVPALATPVPQLARLQPAAPKLVSQLQLAHLTPAPGTPDPELQLASAVSTGRGPPEYPQELANQVAALLAAAHAAIRPYAERRCRPKPGSGALPRTIVLRECFTQQVFRQALDTLVAPATLDTGGTSLRLEPCQDFLTELYSGLCSASRTWGKSTGGRGSRVKSKGGATLRFDMGWHGLWLDRAEQEQLIQNALAGILGTRARRHAQRLRAMSEGSTCGQRPLTPPVSGPTIATGGPRDGEPISPRPAARCPRQPPRAPSGLRHTGPQACAQERRPLDPIAGGARQGAGKGPLGGCSAGQLEVPPRKDERSEVPFSTVREGH